MCRFEYPRSGDPLFQQHLDAPSFNAGIRADAKIRCLAPHLCRDRQPDPMPRTIRNSGRGDCLFNAARVHILTGGDKNIILPNKFSVGTNNAT
jgi:hypothetical protein